LSSPPATWADRVVVSVAMLIPSIVTWVYFIWLADRESAGQQLVFAVGKSAQFALPVAWIALTQPGRLGLGRPKLRSATLDGGLGIGFGLAFVATMMVVYLAILKPEGGFDEVTPRIHEKVRGFGVDSTLSYLALAAFYALIHSGLEEYYWRWFVFGQLCRFQPMGVAAGISSLGFMAHHVILLGFYFGFASPWAYVFSLSVAVGGLFWAWLYHRTNSIYSPWISHLIVDAGIFLVGYDIVGALFR
jgi:membrane protease YdiL (CAAX protease family)